MLLSILDVPLLILLGLISGYLYKNYLREKNPDWHIFLGIIFVGVFWLNSLLTALEMVKVEPWYFSPYTVEVSGWIALFYVLSYPMWYTWGMERMFGWIGRSPEEGGFLWTLKTGKDHKSFKPPWNQGKRKDLEG